MVADLPVWNIAWYTLWNLVLAGRGVVLPLRGYPESFRGFFAYRSPTRKRGIGFSPRLRHIPRLRSRASMFYEQVDRLCYDPSTAAAGEPSQRVSGGRRSPLATKVNGPRTVRSPTTVS